MSEPSLPFLFPSTHLLQLQLNDLFLEGISFVFPLHVSLFHTILLSTEKEKQRKESALLWTEIPAHKSGNSCPERASDKGTHPLARSQQQSIPRHTEKSNYKVLPLYYRFVIQFSLWCLHDGKFLSSNLAQSWILH